jgi:hypothetical protein
MSALDEVVKALLATSGGAAARLPARAVAAPWHSSKLPVDRARWAARQSVRNLFGDLFVFHLCCADNLAAQDLFSRFFLGLAIKSFFEFSYPLLLNSFVFVVQRQRLIRFAS